MQRNVDNRMQDTSESSPDVCPTSDTKTSEEGIPDAIASVGIRNVGRGYSRRNENRWHKRHWERYSRCRVDHASRIHLPTHFFRRSSRYSKGRREKVSRHFLASSDVFVRWESPPLL